MIAMIVRVVMQMTVIPMIGSKYRAMCLMTKTVEASTNAAYHVSFAASARLGGVDRRRYHVCTPPRSDGVGTTGITLSRTRRQST